MALANLAVVKTNSGDLEGAEQSLNRAIAADADKKFFDSNRLVDAYSTIAFAAMKQKKYLPAENFLKKAIELGLNMDMDLAVAKLNLAGVALTRRRKLEATNLLNEAKKLDKQNMLKEQITMMKEQMKKM